MSNSLAEIMAAALPRGNTTIPNPITGRRSENVETVQGLAAMPLEMQREMRDAYLAGVDIGQDAGPFDTLTSRSLTAPAGALTQWRPQGKPLNPDFSGLNTLAAMPVQSSSGWMPPGDVPDYNRIHPGPVGPWRPDYGVNYGRGSGVFRPGYNLLLRGP